MYKWRTHLAYNNVSQIAIAKNKVYAASDGALFSVFKSDKSMETYSKINGLSDNNVIFIAYSQASEQLLIAYENGNIDFLSDDGQTVNFPDIFRANLNANKNLNDVLFEGDYAFLSYSFGIVKLNLKNMEVADTYYIGENGTFVDVKSLSILENYFYAVTADKIYRAPVSGVNLLNFANWQVLPDVPAAANIKAISYNSKLYLLKNGGKVHTLSNDVWQNDVYSGVTNICTNAGTVFIISNQTISFSGRSNFHTITFASPVKMAVYDNSQSKIWVAAGLQGVVLANSTTVEDVFKPNGPAINNFFKMQHQDGRIIAVQGSRWLGGENKDGIVMIYDDDEWKNIPKDTIDKQTGSICRDLIDIAIDPNDKTHFYIASWQRGIYEFRNDKPFTLYCSTNGDNMSNIVGSLRIDNKKRLWFTNRGASSLIKYLNIANPNERGAITDLPYPNTSGVQSPNDIIIDRDNPNLKYVAMFRQSYVMAFDDRGTNSIDDDKFLMRSGFTDQDGKLFDPYSYMCAAQDRKGNLWLGTNLGPVMLSEPNNFFNPEYKCTKIKISRNDGSGLADYLLDGELIHSIVVDGDNRKWIGTSSSGAYLVSEDGTETIYHFTAENSPLLHNSITNIVINEKTGEVFFGTGRGLISFQSDSVEPEKKFTSSLHAYPNPMRPEHFEAGLPISIVGLVENSVVKITDSAGNLVYETFAKGGMATWDGTRRGGERVSTGIYIAVCVSKDGKHHAATKILVVN
jgi:hypothetical protein